MPRTRSLAFSELKIGIIAVAGLVLATALIIAVGGQAGWWWEQFRVRTKFSNVQGMKSGAVVRISGKDIGKVTRVQFSGALIEVSMVLNDDVRQLVTQGSSASMGSLSLLGEPIVEISPAPGGQPLADNAEIPSTGAGSPIADVAAKASTSLEEANKIVADIRAGKGTVGKLITDEALYNNMNQLLTSMDKVAASLSGTKGSAGKLLNDPALHDSLKKAVDDLDAVLQPLKEGTSPLGRLLHDDAMGKSLSNSMSNVETLTAKLNRSDSTMGALLNDKQLYDRMNGLMDRIDKVTATLQGTQGTAGKLLNDGALYENINGTLKEVQELVAAIKKDPKKYLHVTVSIF